MGEPKNHHFYDFGIAGRVPESPNHHCYLRRHQDTEEIKKILGTLFRNAIFANLRISEIDMEVLEETDTRKPGTPV